MEPGIVKERGLRRVTREITRRVSSSKAVHASIWMGAGGVALAISNLILAGVLTPDDFGRLSLVEAILSLGVGVGPIGFHTLAARRELSPSWGDFGLGLMASVAVGTAATAAAEIVYSLSAVTLVLVFLGTVAGCVATLGAAFDQALVRIDRAQAVMQSTFGVFLLGALALLLFRIDDWLAAAAVLVAGYVVAGAMGATAFMNGARRRSDAEFVTSVLSTSEKWRRGATVILIAVSTHVLLQMERLVIPRTLTLAELGAFTVAWTIVGSPLKLLQSGFSFSLLPQLRALPSSDEARALLRSDTKLALLLSGVVGCIFLAIGPSVVHYLYGDKYAVGYGLVAVMVGAGLLRALYGVAHAATLGLTEGAGLKAYMWIGWTTTAVAGVSTVGLSRFGLTGVVAGAALGWALRIPLVSILVRRALRERKG